MPRFQSDNDARRLGEALAALRRERALSQAEAGRQAGMTSQGWGLYETGKRSGLYRPDVQRRLETEGAVGTPMAPAEFGKIIVNDIARWGQVVREAGIKAE